MTASELSPATGVGDLEQLYRDLHANPELSLQEHRTAALAGDQLAAAGFEVTTNIGGTGVVGVLANSPGPTALVRADMDALPVREETSLPYASRQRATGRDGYDVPVMHACGTAAEHPDRRSGRARSGAGCDRAHRASRGRRVRRPA